MTAASPPQNLAELDAPTWKRQDRSYHERREVVAS